jgi:signal peptidase I
VALLNPLQPIPDDTVLRRERRVGVSTKVGTWLKRAWHEWFRSVLVIVVVITALRSAVADWNDVPTGSMRPTILEGDRIVVNKLAYDLKVPYTRLRVAWREDPKRGDIVVLQSPADGARLVKRVIGLPGDTVALAGGILVVNGIPAEYSPLPEGMITKLAFGEELPILAAERLGDASHAVMLSGRAISRRNVDSTTVPKEHYFVMGDNRDQSLDSRHFGPVQRTRIIGQATAVAASVDPEHHYLPRWDRFLHALR